MRFLEILFTAFFLGSGQNGFAYAGNSLNRSSTLAPSTSAIVSTASTTNHTTPPTIPTPTTTATPNTTITVGNSKTTSLANSSMVLSNNTATDHPKNDTLAKPPSVGKGPTLFGVSNDKFYVYLRAFYVVIAITSLVIIYLGVKTFILRRKKKKARHYDVLDRSHLELTVADDDEEDELFDQSRRRLIS